MFLNIVFLQKNDNHGKRFLLPHIIIMLMGLEVFLMEKEKLIRTGAV